MKRQSVTLRRLGRSEAWGWPLFWYAAGMYAWLSLWTDAIVNNSWSPLWILIAITSFGAAVALALIFKALFLNRLLKKHPSGLLSLIVAGLIGSVKNVVVGWLVLALGLQAEPQWAFRVFGGFVIGTTLFLLFSISIGARVEHTIIVNELNRVQNWLIGLRKDSAEKLADARETLADQTRQALLPRLQSLQLLLSSTGASVDTIESLRKVINHLVRPLSEELNERAAALAITPESLPMRPRAIRFSETKVFLRKLVRPWSILLVMPISNLSVGYIVLSAPECLDVFYASVAGVMLLALIRALIPKTLRITRGKAALFLGLVAILIGLPSFWAGLIHTKDPVDILLLSITLLVALICVWAFAWPASLDEDRIDARTRLEHVNQDLKYELSLFDQQLWLARREWQFIVHGTVQAALTAALTRLQSPDCNETTLSLVSQDLQRAELALTSPPAHKIDLPGSLAELQTTWRGICDIKLNITERATRALQGNNNACICVNEIVKEAVSNAVRHGQAKTVTVDIDRESDLSLAIKVSNDGLPIKTRPAAGVGSKLIKELTTKWTLGSSKASGLTVLAASLPLAK